MLIIVFDQRIRVQNDGGKQGNVHVDKQANEGVQVKLGVIPKS